MPRLDKTGPEGKGPKTGRQKGVCTNDSFKPNYIEIRRPVRMKKNQRSNRAC